MFLGSGDIQLGVNESLYDTSRVVSSMVDGIMARVGDHADVVALATHSSVPVINALSSLYHPTQILADLQTLLEVRSPFSPSLKSLQGMTIAWIGDSNNILNEMMVTYPRMGVTLQIATPEGYTLDEGVVQRAQEGIAAEGSTGRIIHTHSPEEALQGADVVTTDTWFVPRSLFYSSHFSSLTRVMQYDIGSQWVKKKKRRDECKISPDSKSPTTYCNEAARKKIVSLCIACHVIRMKLMMRSSTGINRSCFRRLRIESGRFLPCLTRSLGNVSRRSSQSLTTMVLNLDDNRESMIFRDIKKMWNEDQFYTRKYYPMLQLLLLVRACVAK